MSQTFRFQVERDEAGRRLDEFLAARLGSLSRMRIGVLAERGACAVNGVARPGGHKVAAGDAVEVADDESKPTAMTPERLPLDILFEDDQLLVVVKPAGMLVHPTHSDMTGTLANALAYHLNPFRISDFGFRILDSLLVESPCQLKRTRRQSRRLLQSKIRNRKSANG